MAQATPADGASSGPTTPAGSSAAQSGVSQPTGTSSSTSNGTPTAAHLPPNSIAPTAGQPTQPVKTAISSPLASTPGLRALTGLTIGAVEFQGVDRAALDPLPSRLPVQPGTKLDPLTVRESLRSLFATGLYQDIDVQGSRQGDTITLIFNGAPRLFFGTVTVTGVKNDRLSAQLVRAAKLSPGSPFTQARLDQADGLLQATLQQYGYYQGQISRKTISDTPNRQVNIQYTVAVGKNARIGDVKVEGESGMTLPVFRKKTKLKANAKVHHDTVDRALTGLRKNYQKQDRLEANVDIQSRDFQPPTNHLDYTFGSNRGPVVKVRVEGAKISKGAIKRLIPVYEEGAVDEDLLNEGNRNLRDHFQRQGYFDARITHEIITTDPGHSEIVFHVQKNPLHRVQSVRVSGNKYFDNETLLDRLSVQKAGFFDHHGLFSQALVNADVNSITGLYQSNGFTHVKVTPEVKDSDDGPGGKDVKLALLTVSYAIDEGIQQRIGTFTITGTNQVKLATLAPLLNTQVGQPYSAANLTGDRDVILGYYFSHGFDHATLNLIQKDDPQNPGLMNITMNVTEGDQSFINNVIVSGLHYTRPATVADQVLIHPGDVLDQTALLETQRRLYDLTLFNEVNIAVQNPLGDQLRKNVLLQYTEARRWDINYGFGFEVQTGNPGNCDPTTRRRLGLPDCTNGKTGASPRVLFDISRINLRGRNQSLTLRTTYGSLEKRATLIFQNPRLLGNPNFDLSVSGGYTNAQDVTTYAASRLEGSLRVTHHPNRPNTLIYDFTFRRIKVDPSTLNIALDQIPLASQSVTIGGPGVTWLRDTRDNPLDAHRGTYNSMQEFFANTAFKSQTDFNRLDLTNSSYYAFGKKKYIVARSTRIGYERSYGDTSANFIPLPERLYAGGATSHRGFGINAAGPRDQQTGFPIGGAGAFVNSTELRLPNPRLPYVGNSLGFVIFHDMGNVFIRPSEIIPSLGRVSQPHSQTCRDLSTPPTVSASQAETEGKCSFNYDSHALGTGLRYHTPIGPIRVDLSYNLNPPIYPIFQDQTNPDPHAVPRLGQAPHFNFFFSIGQSF
ncbi:MAG TPA: POTRA domain-containing protein [Acidisarcina sp.]